MLYKQLINVVRLLTSFCHDSLGGTWLPSLRGQLEDLQALPPLQYGGGVSTRRKSGPIEGSKSKKHNAAASNCQGNLSKLNQSQQYRMATVLQKLRQLEDFTGERAKQSQEHDKVYPPVLA